jgi:uncharacterized protein (TIGR02147 family)
MNIFEFDSYKKFVLARIKSMPKQGRGEMLKMAEHLRMHSTRLSHILKGEMNLTPEQSCGVCKYFGLSEVESEYFLCLVNLNRAGSQELRVMLTAQLKKMREQAKKFTFQPQNRKDLTEEQKAIFYSSWYFCVVHLATSIVGLNTIDELSKRFNIPREKMRTILDFLTTTGLCSEVDGKFQADPNISTHISAPSPLVSRHHSNWRMRAINNHENLASSDFAYTAVVSISNEDKVKLRQMTIQFVKDFLAKVTASEPVDTLACLTVDWFHI